MPEAAAVTFVLFICVGIFIYARLQALDPTRRNAAAEFHQLVQQHAWLTEQLERANREKWDEQMIAPLTVELEAATRKLAKATPVKSVAAAEVTRLD